MTHPQPSPRSTGACTPSAPRQPRPPSTPPCSGARAAQPAWRAAPLAARAAILERFCDEFERRASRHRRRSSPGRWAGPIRYRPERGARHARARPLHDRHRAASALADLDAGRRRPASAASSAASRSGVVFTVAAWNYPYLIAVNSVVPALMAGNAVHPQALGADAAVRGALRRVPRAPPACRTACSRCCTSRTTTPRRVIARCARRLRRLHRLGGRRPRGAAGGRRALHRRRARARRLRPGVRARTTPTSPRHREHRRRRLLQFRPVLLRAAAHLRARAASTSPSSTAAIELTRQYRLGDPADPATTLGPVVRSAAADADARRRSQAAVTAGARARDRRARVSRRAAPARRTSRRSCCSMSTTRHPRSCARRSSARWPASCKVRSDDEAVALMNDSAFGLTAAIWTRRCAGGRGARRSACRPAPGS